MKPDGKREFLQAMGAAGGIGFTLAASVAAGIWLGRWFDRQFGCSPWATVGGIIFGLAAGIFGIYKQVSGKK